MSTINWNLNSTMHWSSSNPDMVMLDQYVPCYIGNSLSVANRSDKPVIDFTPSVSSRVPTPIQPWKDSRRSPWTNIVPDIEAPFTLKAVQIENRLYSIPELWFTWAANGNSASVYSNWKDYRPLHFGQAGSSITVYAFDYSMDTDKVDMTQPTIIELAVDAGGLTGAKVLRRLKFDTPDDFIDEFNYKLARKRVMDPTFDVRQLVAESSYKGSRFELFTHLDPWKCGLANSETVILKDTLSATPYKDYVQSSFCRNDTDSPVAVKGSDFSHTFTTTHNWSTTNALKFSQSLSLKVTGKWSVGVDAAKVERSYEVAVAAAFEESSSTTDSWTLTDTQTFTIPGQTVTVPAQSAYRVDTEWWRTTVHGEANVYFPFLDSIPLMVSALDSGIPTVTRASLDIPVAVKVLGLTCIQPRTEKVGDKDVTTYCVVGRYSFTSEVGAVGNYRVTPIPIEPSV